MTHPANHVCPNCNAQPHQPCTQPTDSTRTPVTWFHESRIALAREPRDDSPGITHNLDHDGICTTCHEPADALAKVMRPIDRIVWPEQPMDARTSEIHLPVQEPTDAS